MIENVVHAHDVLHMVAESNGGMVFEDLRGAVLAKFGPDVRFTNCADARFTVDELLHFLIARGKISVHDGVVSVNAHNVCSH